MEKGKEVQSLKEYENRIKRFKRRRKIMFVTVIIILASLGLIYLYMILNRSYTNYEVVSSMKNTEENLIDYIPYQGGMIRYSKDGAIAYNAEGKLLWDGSYEMLDPIIDVSGAYAVVADRGGKTVQIYSGKGQAGTLQMDFTISKVQISSKGIMAVLMWDGESNYIRLMDKDGTIYAENKTVVKEDGYPMDIALSDDGKKLGVVLLSVNRGKLTNNIAFFNYGEVGQNKQDRQVGEFGGFIYDEEESLIARIVFLDNNTVCAFKDNGFILYSIPETPDEILVERFDKRIKSIVHNELYTGVVLEDDSSGAQQLKIYDLKGEMILDKKLDMDYNNIYLVKDQIVMYNNLSALVMKTNGKVKFEHTFTSDISALFILDKLERYLLITPSEISEIKLME